MKELTIEEKAKAYDEAQKWIESIYQDLSHEKQMEAEALFPEIAESDDKKKIIKGIESIIKHYRDEGEIVCPYPFVTIEETLAWLEKQGEESYTYNPYKVTIESILDMCKRYSESGDLLDFFNNVEVKCKDAIKYDKTWLNEQG